MDVDMEKACRHSCSIIIRRLQHWHLCDTYRTRYVRQFLNLSCGKCSAFSKTVMRNKENTVRYPVSCLKHSLLGTPLPLKPWGLNSTTESVAEKKLPNLCLQCWLILPKGIPGSSPPAWRDMQGDLENCTWKGPFPIPPFFFESYW